MPSDHWQQVSQLYHAALTRDAGARERFLREACAGDAGLRREVESLLAQPASAAAFLEEPALAAAGRMMSAQSGLAMIGRRLGVYQIQSLLGAGGMGEVYRARDTKLGRDVAIKILPQAFTADPERLARFEREARMLAALNHPHIGAIYGLEEADGIRGLVLELVEGPTLAERLAPGGGRGLPLPEALSIARQIAEAFEAAHEKGIIHRDLKPANVKVTPNGVVKVLDFGLAKIGAGGAGGVDGDEFSQSPTVTIGGTREGMILGTAAYMSPEQARGQAVDKRADIWAFGCVLYEMLAGRAVFARDTVSDTIAAILERDPDWTALPDLTPAGVRRLLRRCLEKDPKRRLHDIADARLELDDQPAPDAVSRPIGNRGNDRRTVVASLGALLAGAAIAGAVAWRTAPSSTPAAAHPISRFTMTLPPEERLAGLDAPALALSPDGTHLAYVASQSGRLQQVFLRALDSLDSKPLANTEGAIDPFFSPDGQWIGFFADGKLRKIPITGGLPLSIVDTEKPEGASWGGAGTIVVGVERGFAVMRGLGEISETGGSVRPLFPGSGTKRDSIQSWPDVLPGGKAVLYVAGTANLLETTSPQIAVQLIGSGEQKNLIKGGTFPRYAPSGHLVFAEGSTLMAAPFDPVSLEVKAPPVAVLQGVRTGAGGLAQFSISATGSLAYLPGSSQLERQLVWVSRDGSEQPVPAPPRTYRGPRVSPDGRRIAVIVEGHDTHIWQYDLVRGTLTRSTFEGTENFSILWTRDGKRLAFESNRDGFQNIYWQSADGGGGLERLTTSPDGQMPATWSADGQALLFTTGTPATKMDIWALRMGDRKTEPLLRTAAFEGPGLLSPDGRWMAYLSDASGRFEVYVQPYPEPGGKWQVTTEGANELAWNPNGRELFYRTGDKMMAVDITTRPAFSAGQPHVLFEGQYIRSLSTYPNYDVSPDGQRFLMVKADSTGPAAPTQINVVLNWQEELKQRVPAR